MVYSLQKNNLLTAAIILCVILVGIVLVANVPAKKSLNEKITSAINLGVDYLSRAQNTFGGYTIWVCSDESMRSCESEHSMGIIAIADAFYRLDGTKVDNITHALLDYIEREQLPNDLWMYYASHDEKRIEPDVDTSSMAAHVLQKYDRASILNEAAIRNNVNSEKLYYTWIGRTPDNNDIDCVVNANVLRNMKSVDTEICSYVNDAIANDVRCSLYYEYPGNEFSKYYFLSKAFLEGVTCLEVSGDYITLNLQNDQKKNGSFGTPLRTAFAINTFINYGNVDYDVLENAVENLLQTQRSDGSWPKDVAWKDPVSFYGSDEITTAIVMEALQNYSLLNDYAY